MSSRYAVQQSGKNVEAVAILRDQDAGSEARIAVGYGFNCFAFQVILNGSRFDALYSQEGFPRADLRATATGIPILAPFPNRIADGSFNYAGQAWSLERNERGGKNAIHGFVFDQPWRVVETSSEGSATVVGEFQLSRDLPERLHEWPADFVLRAIYQLSGNGLHFKLEVHNPEDRPLPFGFGTHPYFRVPIGDSGSIEDCMIESPAELHIGLDACLPTGEVTKVSDQNDLRKLAPIGPRNLDDVYAGLIADATGTVRHRLVDPTAGVEITQTHGSNLPYSVVFIPPHRKAICIEPYSCVTDAINLGERVGPNGPQTGWLEIPANGSASYSITIQVNQAAR